MIDLFEKCPQFTIANEYRELGIYNFFHALESRQDTEVIMEGKRRIMLGSNNYLGLTINDEIIQAGLDALKQYGTGCSGSRFLNGTLQLHLELDDLSHNNTGELRIGISYTRGQALLPLLLPPFHQKHPGITVTISEGSASALQENLSKGRIDLFIGYVPGDLDAFEAAELGRERLFLVVPKTFMTELFADRADEKRKEFAGGVDILCFKDMPFILLDRDDRVRRMADRLFSRYDITPRVLLETRNIQTAFALAMEGMGLTIYPEMFLSSQSLLPSAQAARDAVDCFPLDADLAQTIVVAYHPEKYLSNAARDFSEEAQEILRA